MNAIVCKKLYEHTEMCKRFFRPDALAGYWVRKIVPCGKGFIYTLIKDGRTFEIKAKNDCGFFFIFCDDSKLRGIFDYDMYWLEESLLYYRLYCMTINQDMVEWLLDLHPDVDEFGPVGVDEKDAQDYYSCQVVDFNTDDDFDSSADDDDMCDIVESDYSDDEDQHFEYEQPEGEITKNEGKILQNIIDNAHPYHVIPEEVFVQAHDTPFAFQLDKSYDEKKPPDVYKDVIGVSTGVTTRGTERLFSLSATIVVYLDYIMRYEKACISWKVYRIIKDFCMRVNYNAQRNSVVISGKVVAEFQLCGFSLGQMFGDWCRFSWFLLHRGTSSNMDDNDWTILCNVVNHLKMYYDNFKEKGSVDYEKRKNPTILFRYDKGAKIDPVFVVETCRTYTLYEKLVTDPYAYVFKRGVVYSFYSSSTPSYYAMLSHDSFYRVSKNFYVTSGTFWSLQGRGRSSRRNYKFDDVTHMLSVHRLAIAPVIKGYMVYVFDIPVINCKKKLDN